MEDDGIPERIFDAACEGKVEEVREFLSSAAAPRDVVHCIWRAYIMAPRLEVLTLRGLANRGKIRSADPALNNLVALPNELICQVLAFWVG